MKSFFQKSLQFLISCSIFCGLFVRFLRILLIFWKPGKRSFLMRDVILACYDVITYTGFTIEENILQGQKHKVYIHRLKNIGQ